MLEFRNTNLLVANPAWQVDVQKTGYIPEAGRCLVMQAVIDGRPVVMVLLNSYGELHADRGCQAGPDLARVAEPGRRPLARHHILSGSIVSVFS